ncbi:hypothetical protein AC1031_021544 [Aphanomyces cochlioides]|nr:hypothetical protein AC1031_021544 [Aphanomyces cochlioides]
MNCSLLVSYVTSILHVTSRSHRNSSCRRHSQLDMVLAEANLFSFDPVIISDRQRGLIQAGKSVLPDCHHRYCLHHIVANIKSTKGHWLTSAEEVIVYLMARADSADTFHRLAQRLLEKNADMQCFQHSYFDCTGAYRYLTDDTRLPRGNWVTYAIPQATFDNVTSNMSESADKWLGSELRASDVMAMYFKFLLHLENVNARSKKSSAWSDGSVTPPIMRSSTTIRLLRREQ